MAELVSGPETVIDLLREGEPIGYFIVSDLANASLDTVELHIFDERGIYRIGNHNVPHKPTQEVYSVQDEFMVPRHPEDEAHDEVLRAAHASALTDKKFGPLLSPVVK